MSSRALPRVFSIPPSVPFLPTLARALLSGELVPGFRSDGDPLALAAATIYVPTRRAARELRSIFVDELGTNSAILPTVRPLGEFEEDDALFSPGGTAELELAPAIPALDRLLLLAPLVQAWKRRLPAHVAALYNEEVVVPASTSDSIWFARDLAALMDEIETEGSDWTRLTQLVPDDLANWWKVTLDFLAIVTEAWPQILAERGQSNPAAHRNALLLAEAARLAKNPPAGPVIAAGSTGSIPATAQLLTTIARLPQGAVVLPGLDPRSDERSWAAIAGPETEPSVLGHPQYGLSRLIAKLGIGRADVDELGRAEPEAAARAAVVAEALRPAATTDQWPQVRSAFPGSEVSAALAGVTLVEAANEREEAAAIALALKRGVMVNGGTAALVTGDRELARRVSAELLRHGIRADDSGGRPLSSTPPGELLRLMVEAVFRPGDPVSVLALIKHPLLRLGQPRPAVRHAAEMVELVALRGGTGRPDVASLAELFDERSVDSDRNRFRKPLWEMRFSGRLGDTKAMLQRLDEALAPLVALRTGRCDLARMIGATVIAVEALARDESGGLGGFYYGDAGEAMAAFLRGLVGAGAPLEFAAEEWPDILQALIGPELVKPPPGADARVSIWGVLEARLQSVGTLVVGGMNEGTWPRRPQADRFMSRVMKSGLDLDPPERRIGQAAHDFAMAMGTPHIVLTRSARAGDAPAVASRWLQRLLTFAGATEAAAMRARGDTLIGWARDLDRAEPVPFAPRPRPAPPVDARPRHFSVTEIETLRRDPYAVYARKVLKLFPLEPLVRDPNASERGSLFHDILHRFSALDLDLGDPKAVEALLAIGRECFDDLALPADVFAVWWPRFASRLAGEIIEWERQRLPLVKRRRPEESSARIEVGATRVTLSGRADRIDLLAAGMAEILDYKTGSSPSKAQAHTLLAPQLALEGALLLRGAFQNLGRLTPSDLIFVRLKANGEVLNESILEHGASRRSAPDLAEEAWARVDRLLTHYNDPQSAYLSRALPFREGDTDGDYDHLARVLEWSAGAAGEDEVG